MTRDGELEYYTDLHNDAFNATANGFDLAVFAYQAAAGCVLGQARVKGGILDQNQAFIPGYSSVMNNEIAESTAYMVGHVAIAFPEVTLARDFAADIYRGGSYCHCTGFVGISGTGAEYIENFECYP